MHSLRVGPVYSRRDRTLGTEDFLVQSSARNSPACEVVREAAKERRRAAKIEVGFARHSQSLKHLQAQASRRGVVLAHTILGGWCAVSHKHLFKQKGGNEITSLAGKRM